MKEKRVMWGKRLYCTLIDLGWVEIERYEDETCLVRLITMVLMSLYAALGCVILDLGR